MGFVINSELKKKKKYLDTYWLMNKKSSFMDILTGARGRFNSCIENVQIIYLLYL